MSNQVISQLAELISQLEQGHAGPSKDAVNMLMKGQWFTFHGEVRFQTDKAILLVWKEPAELDPSRTLPSPEDCDQPQQTTLTITWPSVERPEWVPRSQCRIVEKSTPNGPDHRLQVRAWLIHKNDWPITPSVFQEGGK